MAAELASIEDIEATLGRDLTSPEMIKAPGILLKASELFRREARRTFTAGRSQVRLSVAGGRVYLPETPAETIHSVTDDDDNAVAYTLRQQWLTVDTCWAFVIVDYSHSAEVPDLVRLTIAEIASIVLSIPAEAIQGAAGSTETKGPFTRTLTYAKWAQGGKTMLAPDDIVIARSFRPIVPRIFVQDAGSGRTDFSSPLG